MSGGCPGGLFSTYTTAPGMSKRHPRDIRHDPALLEAMRAPGKPLPEPFTAEAASTAPAYQTALRELYSDDRSIKMVFRETGVEPSLKDRSQLRSYLESLDPKQVARLKLDSSQDYLAVLKAIYGICWWYAMENLKRKSPVQGVKERAI